MVRGLDMGNLMPHIMLSQIKKILSDTGAMQKMSESAQRFSRIDAAEIIAREILKLGMHENTGASLVISGSIDIRSIGHVKKMDPVRIDREF